MSVKDLLFKHVQEHQGKARLVELLLRARAAGPEGGPTMRVTGTYEELSRAVDTALQSQLLTLQDFAALVDELEEHGGQHVFLFDLTNEGRRSLTVANAEERFPQAPAAPSEAFYAIEPGRRRMVFRRMTPESYLVKQILTASYWEKNENESTEDASRRTEVWDKISKRACNALVVNHENGTAEIRIDRVKAQNDKTLALRMLKEFLDETGDFCLIGRHLKPVPVWRGYNEIVATRDGTYMRVDSASDPGVAMSIKSLREQGQDVRDHQSYGLSGSDYTRSYVPIYWAMPGREDYVYTLISHVPFDDSMVGKVYFSAKVKPEDMRHALGRIRDLTRLAS